MKPAGAWLHRGLGWTPMESVFGGTSHHRDRDLGDGVLALRATCFACCPTMNFGLLSHDTCVELKTTVGAFEVV